MLSVIIPTHNRQAKLERALAALRDQDLPPAEYEIIVVDDGSAPPVALPGASGGPALRLLRLEGEERSAARNAAAGVARGSLLAFVDDDMTVGRDFLSAHLRAHSEWPGCLCVGRVSLPEHCLAGPFGRYRQGLQRQLWLPERGPTPLRNYCTTQNMSLSKTLFQDLGGFDPQIIGIEDQEFALRHTGRGGRIIYLPEADAVHHDSFLDIRSYCGRFEWGYEHLVPFCQRHPDWPDNVLREQVNGFHDGETPFGLRARSCLKSVLGHSPFKAGLFWLASVLEQVAPDSWALHRIYHILLGIHIFRGYRAGLRRYGRVPRRSAGENVRVEDSEPSGANQPRACCLDAAGEQ